MTWARPLLGSARCATPPWGAPRGAGKWRTERSSTETCWKRCKTTRHRSWRLGKKWVELWRLNKKVSGSLRSMFLVVDCFFMLIYIYVGFVFGMFLAISFLPFFVPSAGTSKVPIDKWLEHASKGYRNCGGMLANVAIMWHIRIYTQRTRCSLVALSAGTLGLGSLIRRDVEWNVDASFFGRSILYTAVYWKLTYTFTGVPLVFGIQKRAGKLQTVGPLSMAVSGHRWDRQRPGSRSGVFHRLSGHRFGGHGARVQLAGSHEQSNPATFVAELKRKAWEVL